MDLCVSEWGDHCLAESVAFLAAFQLRSCLPFQTHWPVEQRLQAASLRSELLTPPGTDHAGAELLPSAWARKGETAEAKCSGGGA